MLTDVLTYFRQNQGLTTGGFDPSPPIKIWSKGVFNRLLPVKIGSNGVFDPLSPVERAGNGGSGRGRKNKKTSELGLVGL